MRVLVVLLNWNGTEDTSGCLDALERQTYQDADVLIVDNGSETESLEALRRRAIGPRIQLLEEPENLGFAAGVNIGIRHAIDEGYDAVALLNNDAVADPCWLETLVTAAQRTDAAITTGLMLRRSGDGELDGRIDSAGDSLSRWGMPFPRGRGDVAGTAPAAGSVLSASGGASLYQTSLFREIGLFDERFFAYFEDVDLSLRARLAGHEIFYDPDAVVHHLIGATSGKVPGFTTYQSFKNLPVLLAKNVPAGVRRHVYPRFALLYTLMLAKSVATGSGRHALRGAGGALRLRISHTGAERRRIQSTRVLSGEDFLRLLWPDLPPRQLGMRRLLTPLRALRRRRAPTPRG